MGEDSKARLVIKLESSRSAGAGALAAYLLRRLASRAGSYAPGIHEHIFFEVTNSSRGGTLGQVEKWLVGRSSIMSELGYYVHQRPVKAPTDDVIEWIDKGDGYRAAILMTDGVALYGNSSLSGRHAVGLSMHDATSGANGNSLEEGLMMIDPWPGLDRFCAPPATLERAHRLSKYSALLMYWIGHA
ncbi:MAG: hypothetical protein AAGC55_22055 [Myxococcota bacterium]